MIYMFYLFAIVGSCLFGFSLGWFIIGPMMHGYLPFTKPSGKRYFSKS